MEDLLILVDEKNREIGYMGKMETHVKKLLHRAFSLFLYDKEKDELLIQQRAFGKYHSGGCWSNSCCSHPRKGEELPLSVVRRVKEELNLDIQEDRLVYCGKFQYFAQFEKVAEHEIDNVFYYEVNEAERETVFGNPEEVASLRWIAKKELDEWLLKEPEVFSAWFARAYGFVCEKMKGICKMDKKTMLSAVDHTLLKQQATWEQIKAICADGMENETASVCIPPSFVKRAKEYVGDKLAICTVIGFPNGYMTTATKVFETKDAVANGADEIDMVINIGDVKDGNYEAVLAEIKAIKEACGGKLLKVIIETCLLTEEEKIKMCEVVTASGADYIKTSTGFSTAGATFEDVVLMKKHVGEHVKVKAAGGISTLDDAVKFIELGASRLGTSRIIPLLKQGSADGSY